MTFDPIPRNGRWIDDTPGPVLGLWRALSRRDWDEVKTFLSTDCIYIDMPVGPTLGARGPNDIVKRLKVTSNRWRAMRTTTACCCPTAPT